jgi:hypothetical protein
MQRGNHRPLRGRTRDELVTWIARVRADRVPGFAATADLVLDATTATPAALADEIVRRFRAASSPDAHTQ